MWEKKYLALMIFALRKLEKSKHAAMMVMGRDLLPDILARWDWMGFERSELPKTWDDAANLKDM